MTVSGWDPTIRDRFESCHSIASFAPTAEQYCKFKAFTMCCSMQFDPNNGDKCQTNEQRCIPLEDGGADAVCIQRNCTELVTTTTTTTPAPIIEEEPINTASGIEPGIPEDPWCWIIPSATPGSTPREIKCLVSSPAGYSSVPSSSLTFR
ncbi:hypothetical protein ANCDUO_16059 [Ancylostoma duodenale]|uniref:Uncharacterized protein n=1 Tax=Ancylostoma duodenale TaxID=51022 RepID=A0A0C2FYV2_9BILA|nr:hypothetical protein ANCDUO_16059 [Ancylostoma duodenale]